MKVERYSQREITYLRWNPKTSIFTLRATYKYNYVLYYINADDLIEEQIISLRRFNDGTHHLFIILNSKGEFQTFKTTKRLAKDGPAIQKYVDREFDKIPYINYYQYDIFTQIDGMTVIVGMSGAGKTYSALAMLHTYSFYFTKIAYLNYELTDRDIVSRFKEMFPNKKTQKDVFDKLYIQNGIMTSLSLEDILGEMDVMPEDKVVFIVDNVGSVIGQEDNVWHKQNEFLKHLDTICKDRGFHALVLTQTVKDHNMSLFDDNGEVKGSINMSIMSGSIMLGNLARTVLFTGFNGDTNEFKTKVLKKGTGLYYSDGGVNHAKDYIRR